MYRFKNLMLQNTNIRKIEDVWSEKKKTKWGHYHQTIIIWNVKGMHLRKDDQNYEQ